VPCWPSVGLSESAFVGAGCVSFDGCPTARLAEYVRACYDKRWYRGDLEIACCFPLEIGSNLTNINVACCRPE
jgi:hypothetical protein